MPIQGIPTDAPADKNALPKLFLEVQKGLMQIANVFKESGAPPEIQEKMDSVAQGYDQIMQEIGAEIPGESPVNSSPEAAAGNAKPTM